MLSEGFLKTAPLFPFLHYFGSLSATILYILGRVPSLGGRHAE